jgi:hypothetical protein
VGVGASPGAALRVCIAQHRPEQGQEAQEGSTHRHHDE